jgi:hypothetical protein
MESKLIRSPTAKRLRVTIRTGCDVDPLVYQSGDILVITIASLSIVAQLSFEIQGKFKIT